MALSWLNPANWFTSTIRAERDAAIGAYQELKAVHEKTSYGNRQMGRMTFPSMYGHAYTQSWRDNRVAQVQNYAQWVYVAVSIRARLIAQQQPVLSIVRQADWSPRLKSYNYRHLDRASRRKALTPVRPHEDLEPLQEMHPLTQLLRNPNEPDTAWDLWYETSIFLDLTGNAYWWMPKNGLGLPAEIWCVPSHWVFPIPGDDGIVAEYELRPVNGAAGIFRFPADEIVHFRWKSPISKIDGFSPLTAGAKWIDVADSMDVSRWSQFKNQAHHGVAVELSPEYVDPTDEDIARIECKFFAKFQGERKAGRPFFIPPGMKLTPLTITPREMDYNASFEQIRDTILALFGVPKAIAGIAADSNRASIQAAQAGMFWFHINPALAMLDQHLTEKLAARFDPSIRIWHLDGAPDDPQQKLSENTAYLDRGVVSINDVRSEIGKEPYEHGGDDPFMQPGLAPVPLASGEDLDLSAIVDAAKQMQEASKPPEGGGGMPGAEGAAPEEGGEEPPPKDAAGPEQTDEETTDELTDLLGKSSHRNGIPKNRIADLSRSTGFHVNGNGHPKVASGDVVSKVLEAAYQKSGKSRTPPAELAKALEVLLS